MHRGDSGPGPVSLEGVKGRHTSQNGMQFKMRDLFISGAFPLNMFGPWLDPGN